MNLDLNDLTLMTLSRNGNNNFASLTGGCGHTVVRVQPEEYELVDVNSLGIFT